MRKPIAAIVVVLATVAGAFALGRATAPDATAAPPAKQNGRVFTGRFGDEFDVPGARMYCVVSGEVGIENRLVCTHLGSRPRYQVVFDPVWTTVYRIGGNGPVFRGKER